jgi:hypothetical protein
VRLMLYDVPGPLRQLLVATTTHQLSARLSRRLVSLVSATGEGSAMGVAMARARRGVRRMVGSFMVRWRSVASVGGDEDRL